MNYVILDSGQKEAIKTLFLNTFTQSESAEEGEMVATLAYHLIETTQPEELLIVGATQDEQLVGCVIFSKFSFANRAVEAFILSPAAVMTAVQGQGIGQKLIQFGLQSLKAQGVELVVTYGDPNFYSQVGFQQITEQQVKAPFVLSYPFGWLGQMLDGSEVATMDSETRCVPALSEQKYW